ncbi:MAG TPA: leucyl aminopeptidase, partial [Gammaproteobacteria bacterium]|nr:leucyl aminopeptidase [Gammaproteobacteria bacterium]
VCCVTELTVPDYDISWKVQQAVVAVSSALYTFDAFKGKTAKNKSAKNELNKITWMVPNKRDIEKGEMGARIGNAVQMGVKLTKDLANTPPNVCNPTYLAKAAQKLAKDYKSISVAILERKDLETLKMGAFLSVTQGSDQPPKLITLEYRGAPKTQQPIVLVGKGITYDTGGTSMKLAANMVGMKFDMCGGASVLGLMTFAAELGLDINLVGVIASAENMPGGKASRPDDIVTTMSGQTVEILNTDAEGRLVLCDALTYCERFNPKVVIDMATLTSACVVALGNHHSALFSNYQPLADDLLAAGIVSGDKCWQMPLTDEYVRQLDSNVADFANVGGPDGGCVTAACYLSKFTKKLHWAHLDIAGTACKFTGKDRGATGQPVPLVAEYLLYKAK